MTTLRFETTHVPAEWAYTRETHPAVAMAIHVIADTHRSPERIWEAPTPTERDRVTAAIQNYLDCGVFEPEPDGLYEWGSEVIRIAALPQHV